MTRATRGKCGWMERLLLCTLWAYVSHGTSGASFPKRKAIWWNRISLLPSSKIVWNDDSATEIAKNWLLLEGMESTCSHERWWIVVVKWVIGSPFGIPSVVPLLTLCSFSYPILGWYSHTFFPLHPNKIYVHVLKCIKFMRELAPNLFLPSLCPTILYIGTLYLIFIAVFEIWY